MEYSKKTKSKSCMAVWLYVVRFAINALILSSHKRTRHICSKTVLVNDPVLLLPIFLWIYKCILLLFLISWSSISHWTLYTNKSLECIYLVFSTVRSANYSHMRCFFLFSPPGTRVTVPQFSWKTIVSYHNCLTSYKWHRLKTINGFYRTQRIPAWNLTYHPPAMLNVTKTCLNVHTFEHFYW